METPMETIEKSAYSMAQLALTSKLYRAKLRIFIARNSA